MTGVLPPDGHVHSEWSWDAVAGSMEGTCARAVEMGLSTVAFTEHADFTAWTRPGGSILVPRRLDLIGYRQCLERCRDRFPQLRIVFGVELGEPHRHEHEIADLLGKGNFERVLGSVHSIQTAPGQYMEPADACAEMPAPQVMRAYLAEVTRMLNESTAFHVLAHIDYAVRLWPGSFDPQAFEPEFREALETLASTDRVLEVNTKVRLLDPVILRWWREAGGKAVCFGSDAHEPGALARIFPEAVAMVQAHGFRQGEGAAAEWRLPQR
jgi:histidinol-phosphatase (PHP family)